MHLLDLAGHQNLYLLLYAIHVPFPILFIVCAKPGKKSSTASLVLCNITKRMHAYFQLINLMWMIALFPCLPVQIDERLETTCLTADDCNH